MLQHRLVGPSHARNPSRSALSRLFKPFGALVAHVRASARRSVRLAEELGHPGAPQILLLHANALAADHLGALLEALRADGFALVSLEDAMRHPLYARADRYAGTIGMSWLHRVEEGGARRWAWDAAQHHGLEVRFAAEEERERFDLDDELSIRRIAPSTWIVTHAEPWAANSLVAQMPDGTVILVDTPYTDVATQALLDWIAARFGAAPLVAINTHFHPDRVGGNRALRAAGARIAGSTHTARLVRESAASMRAQMREWLRDRPAIARRFASYDAPAHRDVRSGRWRHVPLRRGGCACALPGRRALAGQRRRSLSEARHRVRRLPDHGGRAHREHLGRRPRVLGRPSCSACGRSLQPSSFPATVSGSTPACSTTPCGSSLRPDPRRGGGGRPVATPQGCRRRGLRFLASPVAHFLHSAAGGLILCGGRSAKK